MVQLATYPTFKSSGFTVYCEKPTLCFDYQTRIVFVHYGCGVPDISSSIVGVGVGVKFSIPPSGMTSSCPGESTLGLSSSLAIMMSASGTLYKFESPPSD